MLERLEGPLLVDELPEHVPFVLDHSDDQFANLQLLDALNLRLVYRLPHLHDFLFYLRPLLLVLSLGVETVGLVNVERLHELHDVISEETVLLLTTQNGIGQELHSDSLK